MPPSARRQHAFAVCTPGLEALLARELATLVPPRTIGRERGGVSFEATTRQLYAVNLWLRTATRVLVRAEEFTARTFADLERRAAAVPWDTWIPDDVRPVFRVSSSGSQLSHTGAIVERLARVAPGPTHTVGSEDDDEDMDDEPSQLVVVRVHRDRVTISIDSSGEPLYKRGWRQVVAKAPLRETLAAALLMASDWDGSSPLVDPMAGSGTIPIEAARHALGMAPGAGRDFAFGSWPIFEPGTWASVAGEARAAARPDATVHIAASDRDAGAVEAMVANAERAGVADVVTVSQRSISELSAPEGGPGWVITNPPYGSRIAGQGDLRDLFARLGSVARETLPGWSVGLLVADPVLAGHTGLRLEPALRTTNGGIPVQYLVARPAQSGWHRRQRARRSTSTYSITQRDTRNIGE